MDRTVLVVDDSKLARMAIAKALNVLQPTWQRVEAANADEAIAAMKALRPDIALLDFNMPIRSGLVLAAELRELSPNLPIAIISANYQEEVLAQVKDLGATFLPKPVAEANLKAFLIDAEQKLPPATK